MQDIIIFLDTHNGALMVVITLVYVIATIAICVANLRSAKATRDQLEESKRQYEEEHRAFISYEFIYENRILYGLRFTNHGKSVANSVQLCLNSGFIDSLSTQSIKDSLTRLRGKNFVLGIGQSYDIFFGGEDFRDRASKVPIQGSITYCDRYGKYTDSFEVDFEKNPPIFTVTTDGEHIQQAAKELNKSISNIIKTLKKIDEKLSGSGGRTHDN